MILRKPQDMSLGIRSNKIYFKSRFTARIVESQRNTITSMATRACAPDKLRRFSLLLLAF